MNASTPDHIQTVLSPASISNKAFYVTHTNTENNRLLQTQRPSLAWIRKMYVCICVVVVGGGGGDDVMDGCDRDGSRVGRAEG